MRNFIANLFGFNLEIQNLKDIIARQDGLILKQIEEMAEMHSQIQNKPKEDHPIPVNPRQSWGARKMKLEEQERKRAAKAQVDATAKYWSDKNAS